MFHYLIFQIYYWGEPLSVSSRRKRRAIPSTAEKFEVIGGSNTQATITGLKPFSAYSAAVKAFNSGGEGPESPIINFETSESGKRMMTSGEFVGLALKVIRCCFAFAFAFDFASLCEWCCCTILRQLPRAILQHKFSKLSQRDLHLSMEEKEMISHFLQ